MSTATCLLCHVEHEAVPVGGATVIACPKIRNDASMTGGWAFDGTLPPAPCLTVALPSEVDRAGILDSLRALGADWRAVLVDAVMGDGLVEVARDAAGAVTSVTTLRAERREDR